MIFIAIVIMTCIIAGIATIVIGMSPSEKTYTEPTKKRYMRLSGIYLVSAALLLVLLYLLM